MGEHLFDEIKRYVDFTSEDEACLKAIGPRVEPHIHRIIDDFYDRILRHEDASRSIPGGPPQVKRLKITLRAWMRQLFLGPWDEQYYEKRARIGRRHVQINLPQQYMFTAMNAIRGHVLDIVVETAAPEAREAEIRALNKLLDIELAIMLHTYREDYLTKMQQTERLATFGQLVASIAHELRNPLGVMESSLFLIRRRLPDDNRLTSHINKIETQIKIANRIITDLLDIVKDRPPRLQDVTARDLAQMALEVLDEKQKAPVSVEIEDDLPKARVDPSQIRQILANLLLNGLEAAGPDGKVLLQARAEPPELVFIVSDSGPGIDPSVKSRLFEPLVTTRSRGVGLGLALGRKLAHNNKGSLSLTQGPLPGAAFELRLPLAEE